MKSTTSILLFAAMVALIAGCTDPHQSPAKCTDCYTISSKYQLPLKDANLYLTYDGTINFTNQLNKPDADVNIKYLVITDGTRKPEGHVGTGVSEYDGATYTFILEILSAPNGIAETGKFYCLPDGRLADYVLVPEGDTEPKGFKTLKYDEQTIYFSSVDYANQLEMDGDLWPTTTGSWNLNGKKEYVRIKGNVEGGEKVTISFTAGAQLFAVAADEVDPNFTSGQAYFNFTGTINADHVKHGATEARVSNR